MLQLAVLLGRLAPPLAERVGTGAATVLSTRARAHVQRFRALVQARFRQQPTLATLAAR